ncbi:MAG: outer membrane beta-barrel protein [Bacteroidales bacterium]|nr:outer membrane beta-barrel protein [Bacteroidales bacterium]
MKNCLLIAVLLISLSAHGQQKDHKNTIYLGMGSYMISQENKISTHSEYGAIKEFRPAIDVFYNRLVWNGLGIGIGYSFKNADPNAHLTTGELISCTEQSHSMLLSVNYKFGLKNFSLTPYFSTGPAFVRFLFPDTYPTPYKTYYESVIMISPGVRFGYEINQLMFYISYNYDYYKLSPKINIAVIGTWTFPNEFGHHCFKAGLGWSF